MAKDVLSGKGSINAAARKQGVDANCYVEVAKKIMES